MILAQTIELFENLAQYDFLGEYYDFHNFYSCEKVSFENKTLAIVFKNDASSLVVTLKFEEVIVSKIDFYYVLNGDDLVIDLLYRGRFEVDGGLKEFSEDGKSYFYLDFVEGQSMEFWATSIGIEKAT